MEQQSHKTWSWLPTAALILGLVLCACLAGDRAQPVFSPATADLATLEPVAVPAASITQPVQRVVPLGRAVGIKLFSDGVLVVGLSELETQSGSVSPGRICGLKTGDVITHINGQDVDTIEQVQRILKEDGEQPLTLHANRLGKSLQLTTQAVQNSQGDYQLGVWLRDSMAGIGTMTFYDPESKTFAALGHGINDVDTARLMPLERGSIMHATVSDVKKGAAGAPGELHGSFDVSRDLGTLSSNTDRGIYGVLTTEDFTGTGTAMEIARRDEIKEGPATIMSNIAGDTVKEYQVNILQVYPPAAGETRNMMLQITDPELLAQTGGIVQGMSGSPIIQDGKLVGAVTHVLVNDPTRGYGIFIENMLEAAG